jgi:hypothetical protein
MAMSFPWAPAFAFAFLKLTWLAVELSKDRGFKKNLDCPHPL